MGLSKSSIWRQAHPAAAASHREQEKARWHQEPKVRERHKAVNIAFRKRVRQDVFAAYGGAVCRCCSETEDAFLTLDHMRNNGAAERKQYGAGHQFFTWLKKNGFPPGYQVLCMNCNFGRYKNGGVCPHRRSL